MLRCAGIPARHVLGYGINTALTAQQLLNIYNNGNTNHAWTEFYCNGKWYFADATWDSGNKYENQTFTTGKYRDAYFALSVDEYSRSHIPVYYYDEFSAGEFVIHVTKKSSEIRKYTGNGGVVEVPEELRITKVSGFAGNTDITELVLPEGVLSAGSYDGCTALKRITLPKSLTGLGSFDGCTSLETLVLPATVTPIGEHAFNGTSKLKTIIFEGTQEQWDAITISNYNYGLANATVICLGDHTHSFNETLDVKATCVNEGKVTYTCQCTEDYALTYSKLTHVSGHDYAPVKTDATCTEDGKIVYSCKNCVYSYEEIITSNGHDFEAEFTVDKKATCTEQGSKSRHCKNCAEVTDVTAIEKLSHKDENGDYKCDYGCGFEYEKPILPNEPDTPDIPDEPDEPAENSCSHMCHKTGFMGFLWKIIQFFFKLFKINPVCECGVAHY